MSYFNYLKWEATYPTFSITEDQSIADHFLKLIPENLQTLSFTDEKDRYLLLCNSGLFAINNYIVDCQIEGQKLNVGSVNSKILRPSQELTTDGIFQYKHCSADNSGNGITTPVLGTYNLGFRKTIANTVVYQKLSIDSFNGQVSIHLHLENLATKQIKQAKNILEIPRTKTLITNPIS